MGELREGCTMASWSGRDCRRATDIKNFRPLLTGESSQGCRKFNGLIAKKTSKKGPV
jgi:hypothetical protein